ncbi:MAG TPA: VanW family protein [Candidatus Limnocylindrales bacterium]|nr:VanW family protein [Candidatus Limnocylindrales bacterium]
MTTMTLPGRLMRPVATPPARRATLIGFGAALFVGLLIIAATSAAIGIAAAGTILPGITVGGVELSGLSRAAAAERLSAELPSLAAGEAVLVVGEEEAIVEYAEIGRGYETEAMVDAAIGIGRDGNPLLDGLDRLRNLANPVALPVLVHAYDADALERVSVDIAERFTVPAVDASVVGDGVEYQTTASQSGLTLEAGQVRAALAAATDSTDPADVRLELSPAVVPPTITTEAAESVAEAARSTVASLALEIPGAADGEEPLTFSPDTIASWLSFGPDYGVAYALHVDEAAVGEAVAALSESVDQEPVNASIAVAAGGGLGGVIAGQDGRQLDVDATQQAVMAVLEERGSGATVGSMGLVVNVTEPAHTTAAAEAALPQMQMISSWTTYYVPGDGNGYGANINIGAFDIDGRNLYPGEWFSFWESIGPVTLERGYSYGGAIINGRSTAGVAIGGGICSTSTTIFNAALRAGLEMGVRLNHYYYIDRYPDGLDATVSIMDDWTQDMTFRNDTEHPIVIRGFGGNGFVTFQIWSVPTGRTVVITDAVTSNHRRAIETTQVDTSMAPGTAKRVEYPHDGHDVSRSRFVYDAAGNEIHRNDYFSHYATVNGITMVGPARAAAAPEPPGDS